MSSCSHSVDWCAHSCNNQFYVLLTHTRIYPPCVHSIFVRKHARRRCDSILRCAVKTFIRTPTCHMHAARYVFMLPTAVRPFVRAPVLSHHSCTYPFPVLLGHIRIVPPRVRKHARRAYRLILCCTIGPRSIHPHTDLSDACRLPCAHAVLPPFLRPSCCR